MNKNASIEKMKQMRLQGMADYHHASLNLNLQDFTIDQYVDNLVDQEWENRHNKKIVNLINHAKFRSTASIQEIDYSTDRNLDKNYIHRLSRLDFIKNKENIILTGATGTGKSYLAQAIGYQSCMNLFRTLYFNTSKLIEIVKTEKVQGNYSKLINKIEKSNLLILDDFGLVPFDNVSRQALMDIVESKHNKNSVIITSQLPVSKWHEVIGEGTIADAILDRIVYSSHRIELKGESMRKKNKKI